MGLCFSGQRSNKSKYCLCEFRAESAKRSSQKSISRLDMNVWTNSAFVPFGTSAPGKGLVVCVTPSPPLIEQKCWMDAGICHLRQGFCLDCGTQGCTEHVHHGMGLFSESGDSISLTHPALHKFAD